jgi:hypothetical protein
VESSLVFRRDTQELGDHGRREGQRVVPDELSSTFALHDVEQLPADRLDPSAQPLDEPGRECLGNEGAEPPVIGIVQVEHVLLEWLEKAGDPRPLSPLLRVLGVERVLGEPFILQYTRHVLVAGHQPGRALVG